MEVYKLKSGRVYALLLFLGISFSGVFYFCDQFIHPDRFSAGMEIGGISVQGYDQQQAAEALNQGLSAMYAAPITFFKDNYEQQTTLGDLCTPLDAAVIVEWVWQNEEAKGWRARLANLDGKEKIAYPVIIAYDPVKQKRLVQDWEVQWSRPAQNATLKIDSQRGLIVVPEQAGLIIDAAATFQSLPQQMNQSVTRRMPIIVVQQEAAIKQHMLENMGELASFSTNFNTAEENRSHNLALAAAHINQSILAPGTTFSLNDTVGERSVENGFLDAKIIVGDQFELGLGGGVCQVSSTLYNACLLAGLEIVERNNHNLAVAYVPLGQDATVAYGSQDFRFKNNTDFPIYIRAVTFGGKLTVNIYGNLRYRQHIEVSHIVDETIDFATITETDLSLESGEQKVEHYGQPGYVVRSFRTFYDNQGNMVRTEQLARDTYRPLNKLIVQGPAVMLSPPEESTSSLVTTR